MTPSGVEPATFRFVAQHLNHCATAVPLRGGGLARILIACDCEAVKMDTKLSCLSQQQKGMLDTALKCPGENLSALAVALSPAVPRVSMRQFRESVTQR